MYHISINQTHRHTHRHTQDKPKTENNPAGRFAGGGLGSTQNKKLVTNLTDTQTDRYSTNQRLRTTLPAASRAGAWFNY